MAARACLRFTKMHGAGNDYVYIDCFTAPAPADPAALARAMSDRHFGVGADGLVLICPSQTADVRMRMFNADGSEAEMCGNAIRCVAKYAYEHGLCPRPRMRIETLAGEKAVELVLADGPRGPRTLATGARVDMGVPDLRRGAIPMAGPPDEEAVNVPLEIGGAVRSVTCVSMGNPHCVLFTEEDLDGLALERVGPAIERHAAFPRRTNVHFVRVSARDEVRMRTWERGAGATLACGTGASAVCVAGARTGRTGRSILAHLPGGDLRLEWAADGHVFMTGPAEEVFTGVWPLG